MSAITAKASRKMKKYAVLTREPRCFLGSFDFSWEQRKLGEMGQTYTGLSGKTKDDFGHGQARFVTYMNVFSNPISNPEMTEPIEIDPKQNEVEVGDVFFTTSSETPEEVGMSSILLEKRGKTYLNSFCFGFRPSEKIDSYYLAYMLRSESTRAKIILLAQGISRYNISKNKVMEIAVSLPSLDEQKMIGQYFSQLDNLITLHQRKCVFLFGFFQAFISMIFTASTFSWEQRKFDEVFDCTVPNNTLSRAELSYDEGTVLNVHYGDVLIKYGSVLDVQKDDIPRIPHRCREDFNGALLQDGDVIIADTAEDETTGKACEIGNLQGSAIVSGLHTMVCRPRNRMALGYLGYYLNSNAYHHQLLPLMQGIKVLSLSRSNIQKTSVSYPIAVKEQQLIAYYFSQLDNLITLHQRECISFTARAGRLILTANKKRNTSSWEQRKFSDITFPAGEKNKDNLPLESYSITNEHGFVPQDEKFENGGTMREADKRMYYIVSPNSFAYNPARINVGSIGYQNIGKNVIVSSLYEVFKTSEDVDDRLLWHWFKSPDFQKLIMQLQEGGVRLYFYYDKLCMGEVSLPSLEEQRKIGKLFDTLDNLITLHQRKPFLMKWRTSDANRNQTNRLVL